MILRIKTKEFDGNNDYIFLEDNIWVNNGELVEPENLPHEYVEKLLYENPFIEVWVLI